MISRIRKYFLYRKTIKELSKLSDRELADIGMSYHGMKEKVHDHMIK